KKAGVVDAGGRGIIVIFEGMNKALLGEEIKAVAEELVETNESPDVHIDFDALEDIEFAYCTEFMVVNLNKKTTMSDIDKLRDNLMTLGDSVLCIGDLTMVKVHVHTNTPHMAMGYALELGELDNIKIENMLAQSRAMREQMEKNREQKPYAIVAVCAGEGLSAIFKDITVDRIISGGQTMNPSASDIAKACERVPSNNVYVLPNNKNIILAAEQAKALTTKNLFVIPTVNIPQGITSVLTLNPDDTIDTNVKNMKEAIKGVKSGSITHAVRDTSINGLEIKEGDIIGLDDSNILTNTKTVNEAVASLVGKLTNGTTVSVTLFYGEDVKEEEAEKLQKELSKKYGDYDINILYGGQPVYYYLISVE
ncbi:MAG: DAK2 domain-containing protein, partial [Firmicutes bacterium]|nr:DAK2 domain-containing protein [Bacillota bacterium]